MKQLSFIQVERRSEYRPRVRDLPVRERPVSRLREAGPTALSTAEVLACLLQTPDALHQAQELLVRFEGLPGLVKACEVELEQVDGIGPAQAARIKAALEFGCRLVTSAAEPRPQIRSPAEVVHNDGGLEKAALSCSAVGRPIGSGAFGASIRARPHVVADFGRANPLLPLGTNAPIGSDA
jgi:hypothetical protein